MPNTHTNHGRVPQVAVIGPSGRVSKVPVFVPVRRVTRTYIALHVPTMGPTKVRP